MDSETEFVSCVRRRGLQDGALDSETEFVSCVRRLSERSWNCTSSSRMDLLAADLTLLHLAAALGMAQLIAALIKWR